jgi:DNA-binding transcriptional LysR family regulator
LLNKTPRYIAEIGYLYCYKDNNDWQTFIFEELMDQFRALSYIKGQWQDVSAPQVAVSNNGKWLGELAAQGKGVLMAPRWAAAHHLASGELVELVLEPQVQISQNNDMAVYLLYQKQSYLVPKVKAVVDFLVARVKH